LTKWRNSPLEKVHLDIVHQCQNVLLDIFGFIALDYDLEALTDDDDSTNDKELIQAIRVMLDVTVKVIHWPSFLGSLYVKLSPRYKRTKAIIEQYGNQIIEHQLAQTPESIAQRKRSSFISALVSSLQQDEKSEAMKSEEDKTGN
jgi:hypothetical protein